VDERQPRLALDHRRQLPGEVLRILDAGIGAARAKWRDLVRGIANEHHTAVHEALEPPAIETIDGNPFEREVALSQHALEPRGDTLRFLLFRDIGGGPQLQIDEP